MDWRLILAFLGIGLAALAPIGPQAADRIPYPANSADRTQNGICVKRA